MNTEAFFFILSLSFYFVFIITIIMPFFLSPCLVLSCIFLLFSMFVCQLGRPSLSLVQHFPFYFILDPLHFLEISLVFFFTRVIPCVGKERKSHFLLFFSFFLYFFLSFFPQFCGLSAQTIFAYISPKKVFINNSTALL